MSRHQAVRNLDYQSVLDEYENGGYSDEGEEEISAEDQALMRQGVAEVKAALGSEASKVTTTQIEEALWHYYYDVEKSVTYLVSKFIAQPTKVTKTAQKTNGVFHFAPKSIRQAYVLHPKSSSSHKACGAPGPSWKSCQGDVYPSCQSARISFSNFFRDMPWGQIPADRQTTFLEPYIPHGGLLGGTSEAPRMTKLQQLAAARKKKADERKLEEKTERTQRDLRDLSIKENPDDKENTPMTGRGFTKRLKVLDSSKDGYTPVASAQPEHNQAVYGLAQESGDATPQDEQRHPGEAAKEASLPLEKAQPSAFAQILFGPSSEEPSPLWKESFSLPYMTLNPSFDAFSEPSPDDVVLAAQAKAGKKSNAAAPRKTGTSIDAVANEVKALKVDDGPLPRSKNLDVLSEFEKKKGKKTASFVVVGHVDAGKSTMMGRLLLDLNVVDQRTVDKLRQEAEKIGKSSFALAWVLDQRSEERARGVTIDIATNRFETDTTAFTILDAPGHRDFIPNAIAGASQADFAILVIDASTGAFEAGLKGQTREHSLLIRSMGVTRIIVAVNKLDTINWSQERFNEIKDQVSGFLTAKAMGFQAKNIAFVPVSGLHGDNLVRRSPNSAASWYTGPTLVEELENSEPSARALAKPLRMTISDVFRTQQSPVTISGRIEAGSLQMGDALLVQPSGEKAYVKSLQVDEQPADWAVAGQNVVLHLSNIDPIHVRVGDIICDPAKPIQCADTFTLKALAFDFLMPMQVDVHRGRFQAAGRIEELSALLDKANGSVTKKLPKIVKPANVARVVVKLTAKAPLEAGQRVILRSGGQTIAAGLLE